MSDYQHLKHQFEPVYDTQSRVLILGTFPSVKSRENNFYYGHPRNRFWAVMAALTDNPVPSSTQEKKSLLYAGKIAIWDVIAQCDIIGSADSTIKNVVPADLSILLETSPIEKIYGNGAKACQLYDKYTYPITGIPIIKLPSTSPANAACSLEKLVEEWKVIL